jgi:nucleotide-binding universal stress UspA family protein
MTIPWPAEETGSDRPETKKGVVTKLFGVIFIFLGALDSMMAWRGGFVVSTTPTMLIIAGILLYALGAIKSRKNDEPWRFDLNNKSEPQGSDPSSPAWQKGARETMAISGGVQSAALISLEETDVQVDAQVSFSRILVALDASEHANHALAQAVRLAASVGGTVTGIHAYAAKLHDNRFKQMEGGLPERYRKEDEMERQRVVHDTLITRGLGVISDSYHDAAMPVCEAADVAYRRLSPEGKNYRRIVEAASSGEHDCLALGSVGLGVVPGSVVGTVCERVVRRSPINVLVIRDPKRAIGDGPLVVGLDGSARSFGALMTALDLARRFGTQVHAVAAYDPYFHYVAFNKIADVLSEEASQEFRFKEQEQLHEEIIDSGIAKIYQTHLEIADSIATAQGASLTCKLLDGKPYRAIAQYAKDNDASLLLLGKTGIHADPELDIGGNAENLLRMAPCHIWLGQATYTPPLETVARETIIWTDEAEEKLQRVPETARAMVRIAVLRVAQESGHTVVTSTLMDEATQRFCPARGGSEEEIDTVSWAPEAEQTLTMIGDPSVNTSVRLRAEKRARREGSAQVLKQHVEPFVTESAAPVIKWTAAALARLTRVPELVRGSLRRRAEANAQDAGLTEITTDILEVAIEEGRAVMENTMRSGGHPGAASSGPK